ncbi:peptide chain release factor N(5)-glutamine methyltransferase [Herbaspirillum sp. RTI4]|uniref:peptide chain release factor N(5)-glutamine methyltransferase n=1 Tax=Herbaspirillum sp. RTI4 TaxID=3048640 RepID=UPI002AB4C743|nr:peptide chain release factor N(5)-glutamine methyltransferase [Herbaspirillum sp. RTI4]MDY7576911.1 peptide chain release factor N(5)-glutamine methyltransferase [Herbaspirillum sp. RTI4]MEA9983218.1 peptide chain release factor N(5)-glutamine methyltransferase [Herbaspirillum sp. RTI4]
MADESLPDNLNNARANTPINSGEQSLTALLQAVPLIPLEKRILASHVLGWTRIQLITRSEELIAAADAEQLSALFQRRLAGEPIAYLVGQREFYGLDFEVTPAVLIPRPDTELLVELALTHLPPAGKLLDMGTGSGAIAVAIAHTRPDAQISALDASATALEVAARNAARHLTAPAKGIDFLLSNWYDALGERCFDIIVSNPPYIAADDHHLQQGDLRFEPLTALTDHGDGLSALRILIDGAPAHLAAHGWLLLEHGYDQSAAVRALLSDAAWTEVQSWCDLAGIERVTGGRRPT